jgi:hypothetical protein
MKSEQNPLYSNCFQSKELSKKEYQKRMKKLLKKSRDEKKFKMIIEIRKNVYEILNRQNISLNLNDFLLLDLYFRNNTDLSSEESNRIYEILKYNENTYFDNIEPNLYSFKKEFLGTKEFLDFCNKYKVKLKKE